MKILSLKVHLLYISSIGYGLYRGSDSAGDAFGMHGPYPFFNLHDSKEFERLVCFIFFLFIIFPVINKSIPQPLVF